MNPGMIGVFIPIIAVGGFFAVLFRINLSIYSMFAICARLFQVPDHLITITSQRDIRILCFSVL